MYMNRNMNNAKSCLFVQGILTLAEQQKLLAELDGDPTVVANLGLSPSKLPVSSPKFAVNFCHLIFLVYSDSFRCFGHISAIYNKC